MKIKNIHLENFKSFVETDVDFDKFNLLLGANSAGKSNIISSFKFISDILNRGIDNAISLQGGIEYLANATTAKGSPIKVSFEVDTTNKKWIRILRKENLGMKIKNLKYEFIISPNKKGSGYKIDSDNMNILYDCFTFNPKVKNERFVPLNTQYNLLFSRINMKKNISIDTQIKGTSSQIYKEDKNILQALGAYIFAEIMKDETKELMLYKASMLLPPMFTTDGFIRLFDFDPKKLKKPCPMLSIKSLEEDGSNIAAVLKNLLKDKIKKKLLIKLVRDCLPIVEDIKIENNFDQSFSFMVKETYCNKNFHSNFLSDGTVSIIAIIISLFFEEKANIIILEEPERNIHPALLQSIIEMIKDVSKDKQIILTTHNPEIIKHVTPSDILFVKRDEFGQSVITNPNNSEAVNCFIQNELGLDDLFIEGLLG